ncbi:phosphatidylglycerol lysyltransferase domain-containing protein [Christensenellaceae bacterium OttesenSCG-928-L17]|nr:phosphatidylglycerol lysyltransferase domain-containing protein [Christensenellaceae bacterium OttesenSCG-928-L17]
MLSFHPFTLDDKPFIDAYLKPYQFECSEFTFTNMIIWGQDEKIRWAEHNDVLYVLLQFGGFPAFMFPPIPKCKSTCAYGTAVDVAVQYFFAKGFQPRFRSISGVFVQLFRKHCPQFSLIADRDTYDYVYRAEDLISLSGRKYHAKRNHINQFEAQYDYAYKPLTPDMTDECMEVYLSWLQEKDIYEPGILGEMKAIRFLLPNMEKLNVKGGCITINDKVVAFTLGEQINPTGAVIHIEKADSSYMGLFAVINQKFAENCWSDLQFINREEDMGLLGLRKAKLSYRPVKLIEKSIAVLRP